LFQWRINGAKFSCAIIESALGETNGALGAPLGFFRWRAYGAINANRAEGDFDFVAKPQARCEKKSRAPHADCSRA
jgi:hypothetical protein